MTDLARTFHDCLSEFEPKALAMLKTMVDINSFTANGDGVCELGALTAQCFAPLGFEAEHVPSDVVGQGSHLFLRRSHASGPRVLLVTHLDTVFPAEEEVRNDFHWRVEESERRVYGPGTIDIKGGTILIWMMLEALRRCAPEVFASADWMIAANAAEEVMSRDFEHATKARCPHGVAAVLVFEGGPVVDGEYHLVTARKGRAEYRIEAEGRGAHAGSSFEQGINAILGIADAVRQAASLTDHAKELTVNVARIHGGTVLNRVPHDAWMELEMRAFEPVHLQQTGVALRAMTSTTCALHVHCLGESPAWPADERTLGLAHHWVQAADSMGLRAKLVKRGGLSDANYLCQLGPTLDGLGPSGGNAHCSERSADGSKVPEYLDLDSLVPKATMNLLALMNLLRVE